MGIAPTVDNNLKKFANFSPVMGIALKRGIREHLVGNFSPVMGIAPLFTQL